MSRIRLISVFVLFAWLASGFTRPPQVSEKLGVSNVNVFYHFGEQITFAATLSASMPITQAMISFRETNGQNTRVEPLTIDSSGATAYQYNVAQNLIPPFTWITFSYQATLANGSIITSDSFNVLYGDDRFKWNSLPEGPVTVHWYDGDDAFGHAALDAARTGLQNISQLLPISLNAPLDIYVYSKSSDLQSALAMGGVQWAAGHADPALGMVMVSVAPGDTQTIELQRQIPHEIAHIMLYRSLGKGYNHLPAWLNEGIASIEELYPNPDYAATLKVAEQNGSLIPLAELCGSFPADSGRAFLAYAESESFVRYLRDTYGNTGILALTQAYGDGLDCDLGATRAVGAPLSQLEARWRESALGQNVFGVAVRNLLIYILILGFILIVPAAYPISIWIQRRRNATR